MLLPPSLFAANGSIQPASSLAEKVRRTNPHDEFYRANACGLEGTGSVARRKSPNDLAKPSSQHTSPSITAQDASTID